MRIRNERSFPMGLNWGAIIEVATARGVILRYFVLVRLNFGDLPEVA